MASETTTRLRDHALDVLRFWGAVEFLTPFNLDRQLEEAEEYFEIAEGGSPMPWSVATPAPAGYRRLYTVFVGAFPLEETERPLRALFGGETRGFFDTWAGTCYASFRVDEDGYADPLSFNVATLPWAVGYLGTGPLPDRLSTSGWDEMFRDAVWPAVSAFLEASSERYGARAPVTGALLAQLRELLVAHSQWQPAELGPLAFATVATFRAPDASRRRPRHEAALADRAEDEREDAERFGILNSFFTRELHRAARAVRRGEAGRALLTYLAPGPTADRVDLRDSRRVRPLVAPRMLPRGRWPAADDAVDSLMQQAAVAQALAMGEEGIFSVNGAPGTGKTTMLRDLVAEIVVRRAERLCNFDDPRDAFSPGGNASVQAGSFRVHYVDERLAGFEIVVASSNNTAVENVTREIPAASAIHDSHRSEASYLAGVARAVIPPSPDGTTPWGMLSAVLGRRRNRQRFVNRFWFDAPEGEDRLTMKELLAGTGRSVRLPEPPAMPWSAARAAFARERDAVESLIAERARWADALDRRDELRRAAEAAARAAAESSARATEAASRAKTARAARERLERALEAQRSFHDAVERTTPPLPERIASLLVPTRAVREHRAEVRRSLRELRALTGQARTAAEGAELAENAAGAAARESEDLARRAREAAEAVLANDALIEEGSAALGSAFGDDAWWSRGDADVQIAAPWVDARLNHARAGLFLAALRLHESFLVAARTRVNDNLKRWVDLVTGKPLAAEDPEIYEHLWRTFFLAVPVVSTTFASFGAMFRGLGPRSLGWVLIDEGGQSAPQAAAGALMRARRAVVVGDPLQIEPIFTTSDEAIDGLRQHFGIEEHWRPPGARRSGASAQRLADRVNRYGARLGSEDAPWVGCPLRVHRRCAEPMFSIANAIAYDGLMIRGIGSRSGVTHPLGPSRWEDVEGACAGRHWVPAQLARAEEMLRVLAEAEGGLPRAFVITPFRGVSLEMKRRLRAGQWLPGRVPEQALRRWVRESVGTVHTFQGKEQRTVILVLGADEATEGAARWASSKPNLLNVAVTRARERLYVIGSKRLWSGLPHFSTAARMLETASWSDWLP